MLARSEASAVAPAGRARNRRSRHRCGDHRAHVPRLRPRLGRFHPFAIWRPAARALCVRLSRHARVLVRQSLHVRRRLRHGGVAARQDAAVRPVRDAAARGRRRRPRRAVRTWRLGRRIGGPLAGLLALVLLADLPALLRAHVHQPEGRAVRGRRWRSRCSASCARSRNIRKPTPATSLLFGLGLGLSIGSRIMGGFAVLYALLRAGADRRVGCARRWLRRAAARDSAIPRRAHPEPASSPMRSMALVWPWSVLDPLNPLRDGRVFLRSSSKSRGGSCSRAS